MKNEDMDEIKILNPWLSIWVQPRETISRITAAQPLKMVLLLGVLTGIELCFSFFSSKENIDQFSLMKVLLIVLLAGPIVGIGWIFIFSALIKIVGYFLGGCGTILNICAAVACGNLPIICGLPFSILTVLLLFKMPATEIPAFIQTFMYAILWIWSFFIMLNCLMQVQGFFSLWRAFANVLLAELIIPILLFMAAGFSMFK